MELTDFDALSFDCYGTLIDWEAGFLSLLRPWADEHDLAIDDEKLLTTYARHEAETARQYPTAPYPEVLAAAFRATGDELGRPVSEAWQRAFGSSVPDWPAFADSAGALARLAERYRLIIVSNVDRAGFAASNKRLGVTFDAIITAEDVGAYKPAMHHFTELRTRTRQLGIAEGKLLHVAQSLFHDHAPARAAGLPSAWINRRHEAPGWGATPQPSDPYRYDWEFPSMQAFAEAAAL
ncbi:HAD-IA family hydrolase [Haloechinothrix sp. LS1_15]|uniref:HAD-IA family hydrolase n=1 Tax=Haloechinothrix sp. LS1_15 TaxID=2652248 RepID=UPI002948ADD9|nr:HAD-IA family hydrolase [Haloechinothrix sp. LS1_15]MDV6012508.1 HAD-IA family hydrolase [Haloechinothrix sp. LS1_15]